MSKRATWKDEELMQLGFLIQAGYTYSEISSIMGKPKTGVAIKGLRIWGGNPNYRNQITKHKHLQEPLLRYYLNHTAEECQAKFKLSPNEFKSCLTYAYKRKDLRHLRKNTRTQKPWGAKDYLTLLRFAGLKPRAWIGKKLKRGSHEGIRTRLETLNISSKNIQGLTLSQFRNIFHQEPERYIKTSAGPTRGVRGESYYKIVLWTDLEKWLEAGKIFAPEIFRIHISTMAMFQRWIWSNYEKIC